MTAPADTGFSRDDLARAAAILDRCKERGAMLATAESCTGGLVSALLTEIAGSSAVVDRAFVTYSNEAKAELLGVDPDTLASFGAVSSETASEMARGALARSRATYAVSITGIAGPGGGTATKPVGLVHFGLAERNGGIGTTECRFGDLGRSAVRRAALRQVLLMLEQALAMAPDGVQATP
jgi:nicotinamide-nucleotide amidase